jgi:hypothetical protein
MQIKKKFIFLFFFMTPIKIVIAKNITSEFNKILNSTKKSINDSIKNLDKNFQKTFKHKFPPVVIFNPPRIEDVQSKVTAMSEDELQSRLTVLQNQMSTLENQANKLHKNNQKMIKQNGSIGAAIGSVAGLGLFIATEGTTPPCTDIAAGAAVGATISISIIDGQKIKYNSAVLKQLRKQILWIKFEILLINSRLISGLTVLEIQALTNEQIQNLRSDVITAIVPNMTPNQIKSLPPQGIINLSTEAIQILNTTQVKAITPEHIATMTPDMTPEQNIEIAAIVAQMKQAASTLPKDPKEAFNVAQSMKNLIEKLATFLPKDIMSTQIAAFTPEQFDVMTKDQIVAISPIQIQVISGKQFAAIQPNIIPYMTDMQIGLTTPPQWLAITKKQREKLTAEQISMMTFIQLVMNIAGYFLTPACFNMPQ